MSTSSSSSKSSSSFPLGTLAAAAASSFALGCLASSSSSVSIKDGIAKRFKEYNRTENYPIFIGSFWLLVSRQHQTVWHLATDFLFLGLLLSQNKVTDSTKSKSRSIDYDDESSVAKLLTSSGTGAHSASPTNDMREVSEGQPPLPPSMARSSSKSPQRYLELLVHNVSHTDLVLSAEPPGTEEGRPDDSSTEEDMYCLSRPRFSAFDEYSRRILEYVDNHNPAQTNIISFPRHERSRSIDKSDSSSNLYQINPEPSKRDRLPIGFSLSSHDQKQQEKLLTVTPKEFSDLRFRGRDAPRVVGDDVPIRLNAVFFPLLATLLPMWHSRMEEKYAPYNNASKQPPHVKKVLILVSGVGSPRNWTHSVNGNSTDKCAKLMQRFLKRVYPDLIVVQVHSETNIFRYDENITFVQQELMPTIQSYRDAHAKGLPYPDEEGGVSSNSLDDRPFSTEWRKSMNVTLSFADGSPARNHAIQAALRPYRPTYYHCWQLKTFWHESKIVESDIEVHSFQEMETIPPIETSQLQERPVVLEVVEEMKRFRNEILQILMKGNHDIRKFWLRKTQKPVLAVLAVKKPNGKVQLYRGTNMEVSMPTGSLCAERNVIGSALADNPSLKRQDLKLIAVLSVPTNAESIGGMSRTVSTASLGALDNVDAPNRTLAAPPLVPPPTAAPVSSSSSIMNIFKSKPPTKQPSLKQKSEDGDWIFQDATSALPFLSATPPVNSSSANAASLPPLDLGSGTMSPSTPGRRMELYANHMKQKRTIVVHSHEDLNPLRPCGACNEWLKKIAESNPYFEILTFTDAEMNGVYCTPCEE